MILVSALHVMRYLWEIRWRMPCSGKQKDLILSRVEASVRDYVSNRHDANYHVICSRFGTPEQVASSYLEEMDTEELMEKFRIRKNIIAIIAVAAFSAVLLWAWGVGLALAENRDYAEGYFEEKVIEISNIQTGEEK